MTFQQTAVYAASLVLATTNLISPAVLDKITFSQQKLFIPALVEHKSTTAEMTTSGILIKKLANRNLVNQKLIDQKLVDQNSATQNSAAQKSTLQKLEAQKLAAQKLSTQKMITHLFQSKTEPRIVRKTIYDGPFKHGSPMLTHEEDAAAISDCFASFHLPNDSADFSGAI